LNSYKAYQLVKEWAREKKTVVYITADERSARQFETDLRFFTSGRTKGEVCLFPPPDILPYLHLIPQPDIWIDRLKILYKLACGENLAVIAPVGSFLRKCPPKWIFEKLTRKIDLHDLIERDELSMWLTEAGYINQPIVEDEGNFTVRGGIIDIFPPTLDRPVRLELDGDEVASIRTFDPVTQCSTYAINSFTLIPGRNVILGDETKGRALSQLKELCDANDIKPTERREFAESVENNFYSASIETLMPLFYEKVASLKDYLPADTKIFLDDDIEVSAAADKLFEKLRTAYSEARHIEKIVRPEELYDEYGNVAEGFSLPQYVAQDFSLANSGRSKDLRYIPGDIRSTIAQIRKYQEKGLRVITTARTTTQAERTLDILRYHGLHTEITERGFVEVSALGRSTVWVMLGQLSKGFVSDEDGLAIITDTDIFGTKIARRQTEAQPLEAFTDFSQIEEGDIIIHKDHGIGRYLGLKNMELGGVKNDFLLLEYLGGDKLYLPVWRINLISRYIGAGGEGGIALDRLGGTRWTKAQEKVTAAIRTMAMELLKIYAARKVNPGFSFSPPDEQFEEFEAAFPYDETIDQLRSIQESLADMQKDEPMDRLICGDVGYGKTEVAMRAAFKAVQDGKQAAILVPTTVLAFQHYENFMQRFERWPMRIEMLSRFRTRTEQKHIADELSRGMVNIVIGTHRLLQRDIKFKDLGLLIIDEEHRFGVAHKERIRKLRSHIDTMAMSATPIPRTLHFSLSGLRDISIINTPPANRLAIRTYVAEFDEGLIKGAIRSELSRGGQAFFVHNRVETIERMKEILEKLVPEARIVVGHGQMGESELEDIMIRFLKREANVLLCTTIIESGIDISSANTIIIDRADRMGLAQLYQLRGRVGRSNVQAYAYLLTPANPPSPPFNKGGDSFAPPFEKGGDSFAPPFEKGGDSFAPPFEKGGTGGISPTARKRLTLMQRYTELGSGFQIAMHDLEIRGSGNILGAQQSGHINAIGYELFIELLDKAIHHLQGKPEKAKIETEILLPIPAYIPTDYVSDEGQRLVLYRRLASIETTEALDNIAKEVSDRYGTAPTLLKNLFRIIELKILGKGLMIESIQFDGKIFSFKFNAATPVKPDAILKLVQSDPKRFAFRQPSTLQRCETVKTPEEIFAATKKILLSFRA